MRNDDIAEGLHVGFGGRQTLLARGNPLKAVMGPFFNLVGHLPGFAWYAEHVAPRHLRLEDVTVPLVGLPPGLAGVRIGFLTDIHHDPGRPVALLRRAVRLLNDTRPDVILLGGDYVNSTATDIDRPLALLGQLRAPLGVFGVLGNHDYGAGGDSSAARLAGAGITVLRNQSVRLVAPGGAPFWVAGLDSTARRHDDLGEALACVPAGGSRILLAHEPEVADEALARGLRVDLQLSGHSHGGQVVLPGLGAPLLPFLGRRYVSGLHLEPTIYTGRGVGGVPPYIRFNCPPEAAVLTLVEGIGDSAHPRQCAGLPAQC
ncbi:MAG: metallophosphoesterase [Thermomicrobiales bacterium]